MKRDYRNNAIECEKKASTVSRLLRSSKIYTPKQASDFYQQAAKSWLQYAALSEDIPLSKKKEGLSFALQNLTYAMKLNPNKNEREKIFQKKKSISSKLEELASSKREKRGLVLPVLSIAFLLFALIFTSFSLTGYSIVGLTQNNFRFIGTGLFIFGLVFAFLYFKKKEKKK